jgi:uncharacterized repeat protein (TIGR03803 family)
VNQGLTYENGNFYGSSDGGAYKNPGAFYEISPSGNEKLLYSFKGGPSGPDVDGPSGPLLYLKGKFYGTAAAGAANGVGGVYAVSSSGLEYVLYSFDAVRYGSDTDGASGSGSLVAIKGVLYGTTEGGGGYPSTCPNYPVGGCGTVFKLTTDGTESIIYRFKGGSDGAYPFSGLVALNGELYGTTQAGGISNKGTVFEVSTSGKERVLYRFKGPPDGEVTDAGLLVVNGQLYGTTPYGGYTHGSGCPFSSVATCGVIFKVTTSGKETVLYRFRASPDGATPEAPLINIAGTLYGTTERGGNCEYCGTVFKVTTAGTETVLHCFKQTPSGGGGSEAPLNVLNNVLYGTTLAGGKYKYGTFFKLKP